MICLGKQNNRLKGETLEQFNIKLYCNKQYPTSAVLVHFNGPIVNFAHCLYFNMVTMAMALSFSHDVTIEIFSDILGKVVRILELKKETQNT